MLGCPRGRPPICGARWIAPVVGSPQTPANIPADLRRFMGYTRPYQGRCAMSTSTSISSQTSLASQTSVAARFRAARRHTLSLCEPLTPEDMMVQSCPEASPVKWHLAHTAWFFESFVLREFLTGYRIFHPDFAWLFNSYYQSFASFPDKRLRASFSRPPLEQ